MKILHINTYDTGGAANACLRIHQSLLKKRVDSKVLVLYKSTNIPEVYEFNYWEKTKNRVHRYLKRKKYESYRKHMNKLTQFIHEHPVEIFSEPTSIFDITSHTLYKEADIIQLNWTAGFLDEPSFFKKNSKPVIWRMSDLYICSGGYHYEKGFPFIEYKNLLDKNSKIHQESLKNKRINIVAISNWTKEKALNCNFLKGLPISVIHNGIDSNIFSPYDKSSARESLGISPNKKVVLIGAQSLSNLRKGTSLLMKAISTIGNDNILFYSFGVDESLDKRIKSFGYIKDEKSLAKIYSAADLYIMSSIEEAFGQVFIESLACETPVVAFPNGGGLDIIKNGFNGYLADDFTHKSLANAIIKGLNTDFNKSAIRKDILERFNIEDKADQYIKLYESILNQ